MKTKPKLAGAAAAITIVTLVCLACGGEKKPGPVSNVDAASEAIHPKTVSGADCPATGLWAVCSVEKRLKESGFVALKNDSAASARPGFSVDPAVYTLHRARLELYIYTAPAELARDLPKIDTVKVAPVFLRSGNMAALLFTDDATQAERLSLALTAGAPQGSR